MLSEISDKYVKKQILKLLKGLPPISCYKLSDKMPGVTKSQILKNMRSLYREGKVSEIENVETITIAYKLK